LADVGIYTEDVYTEISDYVQTLMQALPDTALSVFENPGGYHTITISLGSASGSNICESSKIHFLGPFRYDNPNLVQEFDRIIRRDLSTPRVQVNSDPQGLVARACDAGGYLHLFFSVNEIIDGSEHPHNSRALALGLAHFILMRISSIVNGVMTLAHVRPMSRNARLSLAALHVVVNRIKLSTSRLDHLRPLYVRDLIFLVLGKFLKILG
jgi:hypothetical protein